MCFPHKYIFKKIDATTNAVNIIAALGQTIDGAAVYTMSTVGNSVTLAYDTPSSTWIALGGCCNILTSCGDLLTHDGTSLVRLPVGLDGQVLTVDTSGSPCIKWANGGTPTNGMINFALLTLEARPISTTYLPVGYMTWLLPDFAAYTLGIVMLSATIANRDLNVRLYDTTNSVNLGAATITTSGVHTFAVVNPLTSAAVELQISQSAPGGISPYIRGVSVKFTATNTNVSYSLLPLEAKATTTSYVPSGYLAWSAAVNVGLGAGKVIFNATIANRDLLVRLYDVTNSVVLGAATITTSGVHTLAVIVPLSDAEIQWQVSKSSGGGINPSVRGVILKF
jgi:hypothetical protein